MPISQSSAWFTANNPILGLNDYGIESDTGKYKNRKRT